MYLKKKKKRHPAFKFFKLFQSQHSRDLRQREGVGHPQGLLSVRDSVSK